MNRTLASLLCEYALCKLYSLSPLMSSKFIRPPEMKGKITGPDKEILFA